MPASKYLEVDLLGSTSFCYQRLSDHLHPSFRKKSRGILFAHILRAQGETHFAGAFHCDGHIGVFCLDVAPSERHEGFSESIAAVSVFASNIFFWSESGYFDTKAELKPLLHTWSRGQRAVLPTVSFFSDVYLETG